MDWETYWILYTSGVIGCITLSIIITWIIYLYDKKYMKPLRKGTVYE